MLLCPVKHERTVFTANSENGLNLLTQVVACSLLLAGGPTDSVFALVNGASEGVLEGEVRPGLFEGEIGNWILIGVVVGLLK